MERNIFPQLFDFLSLQNNPEEIFNILELIEENNYYKIYKAIHIQSNCKFIIKILNLSKCYEINQINGKVDPFFDNNDIPKTIQEEISTINKFNRINEIFLKYYGSYFSLYSNNLWLIFEYCELGSLSNIKELLGRNFAEAEIATLIKTLLINLNSIYLDLKNQYININVNDIYFNKDWDLKLLTINKYENIRNSQLTFIVMICFHLFCNKILLNEILKIIKKDAFIIIDKNEPLLSILSQEFIDFLNKCLYSNLENITELLQHPFIIKNTSTNNQKTFFKNLTSEIENLKMKNFELNNWYNALTQNSPKILSESINKNLYNIQKEENEEDHKSRNSSIDVLAAFRFEQMLSERNEENDKVSNNDIYMSIRTNAMGLKDKSNNQTIKKSMNKKNFLYSNKENPSLPHSSIKDTIDTRNSNNRFSSIKNYIKNIKTENYNLKPKNCIRCEIIELNNTIKKNYKKNRSKEIFNKKEIYFNYNTKSILIKNNGNNNNKYNKKIILKNNKQVLKNNYNNYTKCRSEPNKKYNKKLNSQPKRKLIKNKNIKLFFQNSGNKHFNSEKKIFKSRMKISPDLSHSPSITKNSQSVSISKNNTLYNNKKKINKSVNNAVNEFCLEDIDEITSNDRLINRIIIPNGKNIFHFRDIDNYRIEKNIEKRNKKNKDFSKFINNDIIYEKDESSYNKINSYSGLGLLENLETQRIHDLNNKITKYFKTK